MNLCYFHFQQTCYVFTTLPHAYNTVIWVKNILTTFICLTRMTQTMTCTNLFQYKHLGKTLCTGQIEV